jgi:hypothetical protein
VVRRRSGPDVTPAGAEALLSDAGGAGRDPADPASGDGWEDQAWFDFDDRALPALQVYNSYR